MAVHNTGRGLCLVRNWIEPFAVRYLLAGFEVFDSVVDASGRVALRGRHIQLREPSMADRTRLAYELLDPRDGLELFDP